MSSLGLLKWMWEGVTPKGSGLDQLTFSVAEGENIFYIFHREPQSPGLSSLIRKITFHLFCRPSNLRWRTFIQTRSFPRERKRMRKRHFLRHLRHFPKFTSPKDTRKAECKMEHLKYGAKINRQNGGIRI